MAQFETPASKHFDELIKEVEGLKKSPANAEAVITARVQEESAKIIGFCKEIGLKAFDRIKDLRNKLTGLREFDNVVIVDNGGAHSEQGSWTKSRYQQLTKTSADLKELTETFDKAMGSSTHADFIALEKILKKTDPQQKQDNVQKPQ